MTTPKDKPPIDPEMKTVVLVTIMLVIFTLCGGINKLIWGL